MARRSEVDLKLYKTVVFIISAILLSACSVKPSSLNIWQHSQSGIYEASLSDDGQFVAVSTITEGTTFWDLEKKTLLYTWRHGQKNENAIVNIDFSPDGSYVITADKDTYVVWSTSTGKALGYWQVDSNIEDAVISNAGKYVLLGLKDGRALHINQKTQQRLEVIAHRHEPVTSVDLSAGGRFAITGGNDNRAVVWDAETGQEISTYQHSSRVIQVAMGHQNNRVFSADNKGGAFIWDLKTGQKASRLELKERQYIISSARFSSDDKLFLTGSPGRSISLWDSQTGVQRGSWRAPTRGGWLPKSAVVYTVAFTDDDQSIVAEGSNGWGQRWKLN